MAPTEAAATPLPREETTPPVTKMYLVAMGRSCLLGCAWTIKGRPRPGWAGWGIARFRRSPAPILAPAKPSQASRRELGRRAAVGAALRASGKGAGVGDRVRHVPLLV